MLKVLEWHYQPTPRVDSWAGESVPFATVKKLARLVVDGNKDTSEMLSLVDGNGAQEHRYKDGLNCRHLGNRWSWLRKAAGASNADLSARRL